MEQKLRDFVRGEIMNRFLANRADYPRSDAEKLQELAQRVVEVLAIELPSLEPVMDVCALYDKVDEISDDLIDSYAVQAGASAQVDPSTSLPRRNPGPGEQASISLDRFTRDNQERLLQHVLQRLGATEGAGLGQEIVLRTHLGRRLPSSAGGEKRKEDQESCGSSDTTVGNME